MFLFDLLQCCNRPGGNELKVVASGADTFGVDCCSRIQGGVAEPKVVTLSSDLSDDGRVPPMHFQHMLDPFDVTINLDKAGCLAQHRFLSAAAIPTRDLSAAQREIKARLLLPKMLRFPLANEGLLPAVVGHDVDEQDKSKILEQVWQAFALDLHAGVCMTQINQFDDYSDIHLQLQDDLCTLTVDQGCGEMVEFPLTAVTRIYRIVRNEGAQRIDERDSTMVADGAEHIVVLEFMRRKLVLVLDTVRDAKSFIMSMELLVRFAQEAAASNKAKKKSSREKGAWLTSPEKQGLLSPEKDIFGRASKGSPSTVGSPSPPPP